MINLSKEQMITIYSKLIKQTGGLDGVRDENLLDSAINAPFQTFGGEELYPTVQKKAACLCYSLINNHSFYDGNKRIGILVMMTFMELNSLQIQCTDDDLIALGLSIASGATDQEYILDWIIKHI
ncbi:type II toxin-antitoxin system death-on-curing family toxin [Lachnospiraceae bacterium OttesenSCG-928-D06]|nr:type II toxin-antitoxin system death-on-curing family toxin [Lachnospiraceae bacterium OttesenSCG-928-D06]